MTNMTIPQAFAQAIEHHKVGRLQEAEKLYRSILQAEPNHPDANHNLGMLAVSVNKPEAGLPHLKAAVEAMPSHGQFWLSYIDALIKAGSAESALKVIAQGRGMGLAGEAVDRMEALAEKLVVDGQKKQTRTQSIPNTFSNQLSQTLDVSQKELQNLFNTGRYKEAEALTRNYLTKYQNWRFGWSFLGAVLVMSNKLDEAVSILQHALSLNPHDVETMNTLGKALKDLGRFQEAEDVLRKALMLKPDFVNAYNTLGRLLTDAKRYDESISCYQNAIQLQPNFALAHNNLSVTLNEIGRHNEALDAAAQALKLNPGLFDAYINYANAAFSLLRYDDALINYERAIQMCPDFPLTHANRLECLHKLNRIDELQKALIYAKEVSGEHPMFFLSEARLFKRKGDFDKSLQVVENMQEPEDTKLATERSFLIAELYDRLGDSEKAYSAMLRGNELANRRFDELGANKNIYIEHVENYEKLLDQLETQKWTELPRVDDHQDPVFLLGFPRSGTTLLDTILGGHSRIAVAEEPPTIELMHKMLADMPGGLISGLFELSPEHLSTLREAYFLELKRCIDKQIIKDTLLIDKMPLNSVEAVLIHRLFPEARFIFISRHPCDSALSCLMQNFNISHSMGNSLAL